MPSADTTPQLTLDTFEDASKRVKEVTQETKLIYSPHFSKETGNDVYLKPENMQRTGAYKVRGAYYKISTLSDEERKRGLITASAGNHAQGVAYAAKKFGVPATIVMPTTTPYIKVERTKSHGAEVVLAGEVYDESYEHALKLAEEQGLTFIHPFNDLQVAAGQGLHCHGDRPGAAARLMPSSYPSVAAAGIGRFHARQDAQPSHQGDRR